jgi:hypothetical protein
VVGAALLVMVGALRAMDTASSGDTILSSSALIQNKTKKKVINSDFLKRIWVEKWNNSWILPIETQTPPRTTV